MDARTDISINPDVDNPLDQEIKTFNLLKQNQSGSNTPVETNNSTSQSTAKIYACLGKTAHKSAEAAVCLAVTSELGAVVSLIGGILSCCFDAPIAIPLLFGAVAGQGTAIGCVGVAMGLGKASEKLEQNSRRSNPEEPVMAPIPPKMTRR